MVIPLDPTHSLDEELPEEPLDDGPRDLEQEDRPRRIRQTTFDDRLEIFGSLVGSFALVWVLYGHVFNFSGLLGFLVCWYLAFMVTLTLIVRMSHPRPIVIDRLAQATIWVASAIVMVALGSTLIYTFSKGWAAIHRWSFWSQTMSGVSPTAPLAKGGVLHAIVGTVIEVAIAVAISLPLGLITAVYLSEVGGRLSNVVRTVVEAMTALPEILAGLFVYVFLIVYLGWPKSGLAVSLAMSVTMIPIIARTGEVALRIVPNGLREAAGALGGSDWRTTWRVVLPTASSGLATALILAIARGVGETAIPLLVSGASTFMNVNPLSNPMNSLPLFIFTGYETHQSVAIERAFGAASILMLIVLVLFVILRFVTRERRA
jgi:phosphate transport system permease protein